MDLPLRDIHIPPLAPWWQLALGWQILLALGVLLSGFAIYKRINKKKLTLKKKALLELACLESTFYENEDILSFLAELSSFLRRFSLQKYPDKAIGGLTGTPWLEFLDAPLKSTEFSQGCGKILLKAPYQKAPQKEEALDLLELSYRWTKQL